MTYPNFPQDVRVWAVDRVMTSTHATGFKEVIREADALAQYVLRGLVAPDDVKAPGIQGQNIGLGNAVAGHALAELVAGSQAVEHESVGNGLIGAALNDVESHLESSVGCVATPIVDAVTRIGNDPVTARSQYADALRQQNPFAGNAP